MQQAEFKNPMNEVGSSFTRNYLLFLLAHASAAASSEFHAFLAQQGVSVPEWRILASLYPRKQMRVGQLAKECLQKQPTLTRILDRMEADELVSREFSKENRREVWVRLTEQGLERADRFVAKAKSHEASILVEYTENEIELLTNALRVLIRRSANTP